MSPASPKRSSGGSHHYDAIVLGAGLSGLAAAVRLGMFGLKVLLLEKHFIVGGLNSFYAKGGYKFDVGLHALTNFPSLGSGKASPLLRLCRQLRISLDSLQLLEQSTSRISFGNSHLRFNNDFSFFVSEIEKVFPSEKDRFLDFLRRMEEFPAYAVDAEELSTREILSKSFRNPLLGEMLLCPTCYYGSARSNDIDFPTFIMLFDAIFKQGLARPERGIRSILDPLVGKLRELGVERRMNAPVEEIRTKDDKVTEIILKDGEVLTANHYVSTCGGPETEKLLKLEAGQKVFETGRFSVIESISVFEGSPRDLGWRETVVFFNEDESFAYEEPENEVDLKSGVICLPENYTDPNNPNEKGSSKIRITHPAKYASWSRMQADEYAMRKSTWEDRILENGLRFLPGGTSNLGDLKAKTLFRDTFTPRTIRKFTSRENGALYGSPTKKRDGSTKWSNLFLAGTDQGYVGIVGAMLGGIAVANNQILRNL